MTESVTSSARLDTERPQRYLKQLMSHLGNRIEADLADPDHGSVRMDGSSCDLVADATGLAMVAHAPDPAGLARIQDVVARHLVRFAGAEALSSDWTPPTAG
jgi:caffeoyl-CoA O-methyltransferase